VQCKKKHITVCPEFADTGSCPRGRRCPLRHAAKKRQLPDVPSPVITVDRYYFMLLNVFKVIF